MKEKTRNLIEIHIAVLLFGFSALFAKFLTFSPFIIVFGRVFIASIALFIILIYLKQKLNLKVKKDYLFLFLVGIIYAIHWLTFIQSIQVSTVAVGVLTFSTFPIIVTFLEPYFFNEKIKIFDVVIALITFLGVVLVIPEFNLSNNIAQGALWGLLASITCAFLVICNKINIKKYPSILLSFYQNLFTTIILLPFIFFIRFKLELTDILLFILFGVVFTALSQTLFIKGMTNIKAQLASIISCLEPVYSIIFALILLNEIPAPRTILGGIIILSTIFYATLKSRTKVQLVN